MRESSSMFCDKKLVAINHLYNIQSSQAILSVRGTVRGIKNRVRAGIETFAGEKVRRGGGIFGEEIILKRCSSNIFTTRSTASV